MVITVSEHATDISIVIPVFQAEQYLTECLESICLQQTEGVEVLLIDDGSLDRSAEICRSYARKYPFIRMYGKKHQGAASARNIGIRNAAGRYVLFIDADDSIAGGCLKKMLSVIRNDPKDLYFLRAEKVYPNGKRMALEYVSEAIGDCKGKSEVLAYLASLPKYPASCCTKLVNRQILIEQQIFFEEGVCSEDILWSLRCMLCAKSYGFIGCSYYHYRQMREGSVTTCFSYPHTCDLYENIRNGILLAQKYEQPVRTYIYQMMAYEIGVLLLYYGRLGKDERKKFLPRIEKICVYLKYGKQKKTKRILFLVQRMGVERMGKVLSVFYERKNRMICRRKV